MKDLAAQQITARPAAPRSLRTVAALVLLALQSTAGSGAEVLDLASINVPTVYGGTPEEQFGYSAAAGDLDGDGVRELVVGAPGHTDPELGPHTGAVYVFGRAALAAVTAPAPAEAVAFAVIRGPSSQGRFGSALAVADVDGDGIDDLIVGAPAAGRGSSIASGAVHVFFGAEGAAWMRTGVARPDLVIEGDANGGRLGSALRAGDLDGDGTPELVAAAPRGGTGDGFGPGAVFVLRGAVLRERLGTASVSEVAGARIVGERHGDSLEGIAIADTDGDGTAELVLGAYQADGSATELVDAGRIYVLPAGLALAATSTVLPVPGGRAIDGTSERGFFGRAVSTGDVNDDGFDDLLISSYASKGERDKVEASGEVFLLFGGAAPDRNTDIGSTDVPRFTSRSRWDLFGLPVLLSDLNGDASDDIIISAQFADGSEGDREACGEVYVFTGSLPSVILAKSGSAEGANVRVTGESSHDALGSCLLADDVAGGKGLDLIIGAPDAGGVSADGGPRTGRLVIVPGELLFQ